MAFKKWNIAQYDKDKAQSILDNYNVDALTAVLLASRGITQDEQIISLFSDEYNLIDPFTLPDMDIAVERIGNAIENGEKIGIFGDFDADGVTSTALIYLYLKSVGADVVYYVPDRNKEGYGLNIGAVNNFISQNVSLIITVDNGISAFDEIAYANENGIDVVVTDHHMQGDILPEAVAIVNPHRKDSECEYSEWAGVGVAFKLICALNGDEDEILKEYSDLVCIGTIADIVSVLGENRILIKEGLKLINNTKRLGIAALKGVAGLTGRELNSGDIAFGISPRINASGRVGSAMKAVKLLITDDKEEAISLAEEINEYNAQRIAIENKIVDEAFEIIKNQQLYNNRIIVVSGYGWNSGVSGIVASKICEKYGKPSIVIADNGEEVLKGSCRSLNGFSIFEALSSCCESLVQFGGHTLAAGLSIKREKLKEFDLLINDYAAKMHRYMPSPQLNIDFKINPASINTSVLSSINAFQPFGMNNPKPVFAIFKAKLTNISSISGNRHIRLSFVKNDTSFTAVYFNHSTFDIPFGVGDYLDLAVTLEKNEYYGKTTVSIIIKDIHFSGVPDDNLVIGRQVFENFIRNESNLKEINYINLNREHIAIVYKYVRKNNGWAFSYEDLYSAIKSPEINYAQLLLSIEIMKELELLFEDPIDNRIDLPIQPKKVEIPNSKLFQKMTELLNK